MNCPATQRPCKHLAFCHYSKPCAPARARIHKGPAYGVPPRELPDTELRGMWSHSDTEYGATDAAEDAARRQTTGIEK